MPLHFNNGPLGRNNIPTPPGHFREVKADDKPRSRKRKKQIQVRRNVDLNYVDVKDAIKDLANASEGLEEAVLDIEYGEEYGSSYLTCTVSGWRDATPEEIQDENDYLKFHEKKRREHERKQEEELIERLRKTRPDLLKEKP